MTSPAGSIPGATPGPEQRKQMSLRGSVLAAQRITGIETNPSRNPARRRTGRSRPERRRASASIGAESSAARASASCSSACATAPSRPPPASTRPAADSSSPASRCGRPSRSASSRAVPVPDWRAIATGSELLRCTRSPNTGLPVTAGSPQIPSRSSTAWNASPRWPPNARSGSTTSAPAPASTAPIDEAHSSSAPVLPAHMRVHCSGVTSTRPSRSRSCACPSINRAVASESDSSAAARCGEPASSST